MTDVLLCFVPCNGALGLIHRLQVVVRLEKRSFWYVPSLRCLGGFFLELNLGTVEKQVAVSVNFLIFVEDERIV